MVYIIADNIISPLGVSSEQNYKALLEGRSALKSYPANYYGIPDGFVASLFSSEQEQVIHRDNLTRFEGLVVSCAQNAVAEAGIDISSERVVLVLSTTKGNLEKHLGDSAVQIARALGVTTTPIVSCNACISGLTATILAERLIENGDYDYAVVCGADLQNQFIISGFGSLMALSAQECKPFDIERLGLNLGEAAATVVLSRTPKHEGDWSLRNGSIRNDAYHISTPSKNGDGAYKALEIAMQDIDKEDIAFVNAHGTATMFNDQMEAVAIQRAGLIDKPVNALKGYFGHTMGAAGILETILSIRALEDGNILATRGFEEIGVSAPIKVSSQMQHSAQRSFVKMISGFGGGNAAILATKGAPAKERIAEEKRELKTVHSVKVTPEGAWVDGELAESNIADGEQIYAPLAFLSAIYKGRIGNYPKFYKMDQLSRLGFVATELLLEAESKAACKEDVNDETLKSERFTEREDRAVIFFNRSSSIMADTSYTASISGADNYFPSPALFVYTLPNIVTGEIALRNKYKGETSFCILPFRDEEIIGKVLSASLLDSATTSMIAGWIDYENDGEFIAELEILETRINNKGDK